MTMISTTTMEKMAMTSTAKALREYLVPYFHYGTLTYPTFLAGKLGMEARF